MLLLRLTAALDRARVGYAVVGGYAVALHGAVRGTLDIDLVLRFDERQFQAAERALRSIGLEPRLPVTASDVFRFREEYVRNRNMTDWTFVNPARPSEIVDVILTRDLREIRVKRVKVRGSPVKLASIDDLIRMKIESNRPQDVEDVKALRKLR